MEPARVPKSFGCLPQGSLSSSLGRLLTSKASPSSSPRASSSSSANPISPRPRRSHSSKRKTGKEDELREVFRRFDGDEDGKISAVELRAYFSSIGEYMSYEEAQGVIEHLDTDGDNLIDFRDFMRMMTREGEHEDLKAAFEMFEFQKGSGRITAQSLQRVLSRLGDMKSHDECVAMIQEFDTDGNGELDFYEFNQMMMA